MLRKVATVWHNKDISEFVAIVKFDSIKLTDFTTHQLPYRQPNFAPILIWLLNLYCRRMVKALIGDIAE